MDGVGFQSRLKRVLVAFSRYNNSIGYVQGMNFLAASILHHCSETVTFCLLVKLMDDYAVSEIFAPGLPGLSLHQKQFESILKREDAELYSLLVDDSSDCSILDLVFQNWLFTLFTSEIPLSLNHAFLSQFFD